MVAASWLLVVKHSFLSASVSRPSFYHGYLPEALGPPFLRSALGCRAEPPLSFMMMLVPPHQCIPNALVKVCPLASCGESSTGPFSASSSVPIPAHPQPLHHFLGHLPGELGNFYFTQHCPLVYSAEHLSMPWSPCQDIKFRLWGIAIESVNFCFLQSYILALLIKSLQKPAPGTLP